MPKVAVLVGARLGHCFFYQPDYYLTSWKGFLEIFMPWTGGLASHGGAIALILAMSTGINAYINDIQRDTLSSYPITLEAEHADLSSLLSAIGAGRNDREAVTHDTDAVYSSARLYTMMNAIFNTEVSKYLF